MRRALFNDLSMTNFNLSKSNIAILETTTIDCHSSMADEPIRMVHETFGIGGIVGCRQCIPRTLYGGDIRVTCSSCALLQRKK